MSVMYCHAVGWDLVAMIRGFCIVLVYKAVV